MEIDWMIHLVANNKKCEVCGETEYRFKQYACNAHSHGMEKYNHKDFQMVLLFPPKEISRIINSLCMNVSKGQRYKDGDLVYGIYEDCPVKLVEFEETGRKVLRVIIPDKNNAFPDDPNCQEVYRMQLLETSELYENEMVRYH